MIAHGDINRPPVHRQILHRPSFGMALSATFLRDPRTNRPLATESTVTNPDSGEIRRTHLTAPLVVPHLGMIAALQRVEIPDYWKRDGYGVSHIEFFTGPSDTNEIDTVTELHDPFNAATALTGEEIEIEETEGLLPDGLSGKLAQYCTVLRARSIQ